MFDVIISTVSSGRVRRRRFDNRIAAERWAHHIEALARRFRLGLRAIRVELVRVV
jgi:hypothetical protein